MPNFLSESNIEQAMVQRLQRLNRLGYTWVSRAGQVSDVPEYNKEPVLSVDD